VGPPKTDNFTQFRLSILELDSLELCRVRADLLFTYKLVFGLIDASLCDFFIPRFNESIDEVTIINCTSIPTCKSNIRSKFQLQSHTKMELTPK